MLKVNRDSSYSQGIKFDSRGTISLLHGLVDGQKMYNSYLICDNHLISFSSNIFSYSYMIINRTST